MQVQVIYSTGAFIRDYDSALYVGMVQGVLDSQYRIV